MRTVDPNLMTHLDENKYTVIQGQIINKEKAEERKKQATEQLIKRYKFNAYPNRESRRNKARELGYLAHGWQMYRAPEGSNIQTIKRTKGYVNNLAELS